jgi:hypothetical protein
MIRPDCVAARRTGGATGARPEQARALAGSQKARLSSTTGGRGTNG